MMNKLFLGIIISLAIFLRFWQLSEVPPSLSHDEVAIGYNAYSVLRTGKDEYGNFMPLLFRSFDDYKLPGMVYSTAVSVGIFGLNEFGVRFPSAFFGVLSVIFFYLILKESLSKQYKYLPFIGSLFFAISIWHVNFSRQLFESNGALFFLILGTFFLLKFKKKPKNLIFASVFYAISFYFYYSVRMVIPFILITFLILNRKLVISNLKVILFSFLIGLILLLPFVPSLISQQGFARINMVSVANDRNFIERKERFAKITMENNNLIFRIIYNRRVALVLTAAENYYKNLSFTHIFKSGTGPLGLLYLYEIPLFIYGIYCLIFLKNSSKWIFVTWFLAAPLVGAFSTNQPNSLRALLNAPMFSLLSSLGFVVSLSIIKNNTLKKGFVGIFSILLIFLFYQFLSIYFISYPKENSLHFGDGYKQMAYYLRETEDNYERIYISGEYWRPYIFVLFWNKYDPIDYQKNGSKDSFSKYYFGRSSWDKDGYYLGSMNFNFKELNINNKKKVLFILTKPDYEAHKDKFVKLDSINGKYVNDIFISAILK